MLTIPKFLLSHFRTNHAGETGAVFIYKGILLVSKNQEIIKFAKDHLDTELGHLKKINQIIPRNKKSKLIFLWKIFGFLTGFIPSLFGRKFIYATIFSVESFVETHYQEQINMLSKRKEHHQMKVFINDLMHDEINHKKQAMQKLGEFNRLHKIWGKIVTIGSLTAVKISKII